MATTERDAFAGQVRDALAHLYDRPYMLTHPLGPLLADSSSGASPDDVRRLLLDAIEQLRPPGDCPPASPAWRPYRYLVLRYVEGARPEQVARELQISVRQSRREHERALEALTAVLWERRRRLACPVGVSTPLVPVSPTAQTGADREDDRASPEPSDELLRIGSLPPSEPASVVEAVREAVGIVARLAEMRKANLEVKLPPDPPPVRVQRLVLRQVLIGLLGWAYEACPSPLVRLAGATSEQVVNLEVVVTSAAGEWHPASAEADARLAAIRTLIQLQSGSLRVASAEGDPLRAVLSLPVAGIRTLLVVDDNPDVAYLFSRYLRGHGYRVLQASTGQAALQIAREVRPDAITLDVLMPSQDGWDILRELSSGADTRHIPIILCSVLPERSLALSLGVAEFLNKPVTQSALLDALRRCLPPLAQPG